MNAMHDIIALCERLGNHVDGTTAEEHAESQRLAAHAEANGLCVFCCERPATTEDGERCESGDVCPTCEMSRSEPH